MVVRTRRLIVRLVPPIILDGVRALRAREGDSGSEWEYHPAGWPDEKGLAGWDQATVAERHRLEWPALLERAREPHVVSGIAAADDRAEATDWFAHNSLMTFAYVVARASAGRSEMSLLDWGGGPGHYAVLARGLFPSLRLDYHCRELAAVARLGRELLPGDTFHDDDASALSRTYDVVLASGSLQYMQDWRGCLARLSGSARHFVYVTRLPILRSVATFAVSQRPQTRYQTEYPGWFINRSELLATAWDHNLRLVREFVIAEQAYVPGAPEQPDFRGFLFAASKGMNEPPGLP